MCINTSILKEKQCRKCGIVKPINDFIKDKSCKSGRGALCKECRNAANREQKRRNRDKIKKSSAEYYKKNKESIDAKNREWRSNNLERFKKNREAYSKKNRNRINELTMIRRKNNIEYFREYDREYKSKILETENGRLNNKMRSGICLSLKGNKNGKPWESLVGYSLKNLKKHLEKNFLPGMDWSNWGKYGWHIDHIVPISAFCFFSYNDLSFKECWSLKNLRPIWSTDNLKKHNKLVCDFQMLLF